MFLAQKLTTCSFPIIGKYLGNRDHTTVIAGVDKISERLAEGDEELAGAIEDIGIEELKDWQAQLDPVIAPVNQALEKAQSYEDFLNALDVPGDAAALQSLADNMASANLKARAEGDANNER